MLKNYLKIAVRNILKHKFFSAINILGMTIGITACLLLVLYVTDELSFDRFHANNEKIYQVDLRAKIGEQTISTSNTCPPMAEALVSEVPGVRAATRLAQYFGQPVVKYEDKIFTEDQSRVFFADSNFFSFFTFNVLEGDPSTALQQPNSIVLTESMVKKYFGESSAMGKMLTIGNENTAYKVTAVTTDCPANSHFRYNMLLSSRSREDLRSQVWLNNYLYTYFLLDENATVQQVTGKFDELAEKYVGPEIEKFMGVSMKQMKAQGGDFGYFATAMTDLHLKPQTRDFIEPPGNIMYVYFFGGVGIFIIIIACINFMNLSTAKSAGRAKEVGLRKTLGSKRSQMVRQFLAESMLYSFVTVVLSIILCYILLPQFNLLSGKELTMNVLTTPVFFAGVIGLALIVGLLAGSYPAFYLTSFSAVEVLKGKLRSGMKTKGVRSTLVVLQFGLSIFLIIFTSVVYQQISFMQERNIGFDKHNILKVNNTRRLGTNMEAFKNAVKDQSNITGASYTNANYPKGGNNTTVFKALSSGQEHIMMIYYSDYDHQQVMKFELKEGRFFSKDFATDSTAIVINEAAVKEFGFKNPLDEELQFRDDGEHRLKIVGVIKDFNFESLKNQVRPLAIGLTDKANQLIVRYTGSASNAVANVEKVWKQQASADPFDYEFIDQNFDELFRSEQRMGRVFGVFSGLAIFIACLGLFALAAFTAEQRTKEIGIRKAMGASTSGLTMLLSKEFTKLVLIAFVPASAVAWYVVTNWLSSFAYHIELSPLVFVASGLVAIAIAWITVGYQSIKAASTNPVNSLRYE